MCAAMARALSKTQPKYRFPWRGGNRFELLIDGKRFFPRMLEAIDGAGRYILLEMYLFESGIIANQFIDSLIRAARRGVTGKLLLDDFGARGLSRYDRQRLIKDNIELVFYNPLRYGKLFNNLARDHRKLLVVDGTLAFVGGAGITDEFDPPARPQARWRETMVQIQGPVLADWQALFVEVWNRNAPKPLTLPAPPATACPPGAAPPGDALSPTTGSNPDGMLGRVTLTKGPVAQEIKRSLIKRIRSAEHRVWIATAYFIPSWKIRRALRRAARQGVDVRLLLPGPYTDHPAVRQAGRRFYTRLLLSGVRIFEYQPRVLHAKTYLCDRWVSIGSSNLDRWNLRWNLEANQAVDDQAFAEEVEAMFVADFRDSVEYQYEEWLRRPSYVRVSERLWGAVDLWLNRLGRGKEKD